MDPGLKWPNDLVAGDGGSSKLAGVLAEVVTGPPFEVVSGAEGAPAVVVGLGLNVNWPPRSDLVPPTAVPDGATSLALLSDVPLDPDQLLERVLEHLDRRIADLFGTGPRPGSGPDFEPAPYRELIEEYRSRCVTIGRDVRVEEPTGEFTGVATDVTDEGQLLVVTPSGTRVVMAGDVVHLRHQADQVG